LNGKASGIASGVRACLVSALLWAAPARAEEVYVPYRNQSLWSADTLYLGATFSRLTDAPVRIWLKGGEALWVSRLSVIDPVTGAVVPLLQSTDPRNVPIILSNRINMPIGAPIYFRYEVTGQGQAAYPPSPEELLPRYTGRNLPGDRYFSQASSDNHPNPSLRFGHIWSLAGRVDANLIEFGFENQVPAAGNRSDMDFDDVILQAEGLSLVREGRTARRRSYVW
jgi:hypothetical protein